MKRFAAVILNWNGADDTIDCVRSIRLLDRNAVPLIIDNGSADDSVAVIKRELAADGMRLLSGPAHEVRGHKDISDIDVLLVEGTENLGFSAGCNLGLDIAAALAFDVSVFLNNDTEIESGSLTSLVARLGQAESDVFAVLPRIMVHGTDRIWNCGGTISRLGFRRYHFAGAKIGDVRLPKELRCSFFTGCCFAVRTSEFAARGGFTQRFFFGEEDFELSLWMKDQGYTAVCLTDAVIHHKVSASISRAAGNVQASKVFVHYLNRFVHMRLRMGRPLWIVWLTAYVPYVGLLLIRNGIVKLLEMPRFFRTLVGQASRQDAVTRANFESILRKRPW
jgi:GT2 family glycosyltransferase